MTVSQKETEKSVIRERDERANSSPVAKNWTMCRVLDVLLALLSRFLFAVHGIVTVWRVVVVKGEPCYWLLLMGVALLGVEMGVTIKCTRKAEWKWFSPMVFLYLSTVIPSIWFLELNLLQLKLPINSSSPDLRFLSHIPVAAVGIVKFVRVKQQFLCQIKSTVWTRYMRVITKHHEKDKRLVQGLADLKPENWVAGLEQTMLIVLVLGRWLMPKGDMSRDQLSQLLMVYVGLGADILDIFDTFKEPEVKTNHAVIIVGLSLFSWALMQFPLVLTQTNPPYPHTKIHLKPTRPEVLPCHYTSCCSSEIWSLLLTVGLQDGPFLVYRLYLMLRENVLNQLMIFFTCKNILIVMLELYRISVVHFELHRPGGRERSPDEPQRQTERVEGKRFEDLESRCQEVNENTDES
ncbi:transmembrane protein 26-like [Silurus asotus]|uniref:Transmembrane protein 26-like n=1 Tax=Silurus asotus TaxID=30991 RepID=A0AAD5FCA7_SILAS|nr:transmembrane protein 26-like [Silurus asotus]